MLCSRTIACSFQGLLVSTMEHPPTIADNSIDLAVDIREIDRAVPWSIYKNDVSAEPFVMIRDRWPVQVRTVRTRGVHQSLTNDLKRLEKIDFFVQTPEFEIEGLEIFSKLRSLVWEFDTQKGRPRVIFKNLTRWPYPNMLRAIMLRVKGQYNSYEGPSWLYIL